MSSAFSARQSACRWMADASVPLVSVLRYGVAMVAQDVIEAAGQTLAAVADDPVKIVLFGSRARGDAGPDSDFDWGAVEGTMVHAALTEGRVLHAAA